MKKSDEWWDSFYSWVGGILLAVIFCGVFCFSAAFLVKAVSHIDEVGLKNIVSDIWEGDVNNGKNNTDTLKLD